MLINPKHVTLIDIIIHSMNIFHSIVLGIVEGITEFLPISSTFHLIYGAKFIGVKQDDFAKLFEVFIQSGAILSVLILYINELWKDRLLVKKILVSFIPTAIIGLLLHKLIKDVFFDSNVIMMTAFFLMGIWFFVLEYLIWGNKIRIEKKINGLNYKQAFFVGVAQSLAVIPGVSRAGAVIVMMMVLGYRRDESAKYSFMLSIPTIFAASFYDLYKMRDVAMTNTSNIGILLIGFVTAFISSYIIVKWFISFIARNSLLPFAWYRIVAGIIILAFLGISG